MKKVILSLAIVAIAAIATMNVRLRANDKSEFSSISLLNIEALAEGIEFPNFELPKDNTKVSKYEWDDFLQGEICKAPGSSC